MTLGVLLAVFDLVSDGAVQHLQLLVQHATLHVWRTLRDAGV